MHFLAKKAQTQAVHHCTKSFNLKQNNVCLEMKQIFMSKNIWKRMAWISLNKKRNASVFLILIEIFDNGCRQWLQNHCDDCSHGCFWESPTFRKACPSSEQLARLLNQCVWRGEVPPVFLLCHPQTFMDLLRHSGSQNMGTVSSTVKGISTGQELTWHFFSN